MVGPKMPKFFPKPPPQREQKLVPMRFGCRITENMRHGGVWVGDIPKEYTTCVTYRQNKKTPVPMQIIKLVDNENNSIGEYEVVSRVDDKPPTYLENK